MGRGRRAPPPPTAQKPTANKQYVGPVWHGADGERVAGRRDEGTGQGRVAVDIAAGAKVFVDGQLIATGPARGVHEVAPGRHLVRIEQPLSFGDGEVDLCVRELDVEVYEGKAPLDVRSADLCGTQRTTLSQPVSGPGTTYETQNIGMWAAGGASIVLVVAGGAFIAGHFNAAGRRDQLLQNDPSPADGRPLRDLDNEAYRWSIASAASFGLAAVGIGATLLLWMAGSEDLEIETDSQAGPSGYVLRF